MYKKVGIPREKKNQLVPISPQKTFNTSSLQFEDMRAEAITQRKLRQMADKYAQLNQFRAIQKMARNDLQTKTTAQLRSLKGDQKPETTPRKGRFNPNGLSPRTTQLKIHVKSGEKFDRVQSKLKTKAPKLSELATSTDIFYVKSMADVRKMIRGQNTPILANKKHLIGEDHSQSNFKKAVTDWGWAAGRMMEALSTNARMGHLAGNRARKRKGGDYYGALPLEDTIAKDLTLLIKAYRFMTQCAAMAKEIEKAFSIVPRPTPTESAPLVGSDTTTNALRETIKAFANVAGTMYNATRVDNVIEDMRGYAGSAPGPIRQFFGESAWAEAEGISTTLGNGTIMGRLQIARENLKAQDGKNNVYYATEARLLAGANTLNRLINHLRRLLKNRDPDADTAHNIDKRVTDAKNNGVQEMNPIRERYMAQNIAGHLGTPGLVKIGKKHVTSVAAVVPGAIGYADYAAFKDKSTANKVI